MILTKAEIKEYKDYYDFPVPILGSVKNLIETIEHAWTEADEKEIAHEKARREVEVELNDCYKRCNTLENAIETITDTYQLEASDYDWLIEILGGA